MLYSNMEPTTIQTNKTELNDVDKEKEKQARENHCEIERRRRVKMAAYFNELCAMVPTCNTLQRKPDKLTILRMASSHMRALRGHHQILSNDNTYKPSFLTDQELKYLILEAADGFLFVAQCDSGNIIYVSDTIQQVLCYSSNDWYHRSLFDFVHTDDLDKVKDQLSSQETNTIGRVLDLKTGTVKKEGHPNAMRSHMGSRRAFICRIRVGSYHQQQQQNQHHFNYNQQQQQQQQNGYNYINRPNIHNNALGETNTNVDGNNYAVVHITGYTKSWPPINNASNTNTLQMDCHDTNNNDNQNQNSQFCLVAIARIQATSIPNDTLNLSNIEFVTRVDQNGIISFVDQRVTQILGYQTSELIKKPIYDICILQDQSILKEQIKILSETKSMQPLVMQVHLKSINQEIYTFKTSSYAFTNPYNDDFEFIVCTFTLQKENELNNSAMLDQQTTVNNTNLINNNTNNNNYSLQHVDSSKQQQQQQNYSPFMLSNTNQETYQNLYANQQISNTVLNGRAFRNTSTPSSTPSSLSSTSSVSATSSTSSSSSSSSSSSTSTPPLTQITQAQTPPTNQSQQFSVQQQRNSTLISTNTNLTWPNYDQQSINTNPSSSSILVQTNTNPTSVLPTTSSTSNIQTTQYLHTTPTQYNTQMIAQPQQQTASYGDWMTNTQLTNNLLLNNNSNSNWQQMSMAAEQQNCDLLDHQYQQQSQHINIQQQSLLGNTNQTPSTNLNEHYNYQYMTM